MAGAFPNITEKRSKEMASNRTVSLDILSFKTAPVPTNNTPVHHSSDAIITNNAITLVNASRIVKRNPPTNYFRPAHSQINFGKLNFLITHMPNENTIDAYVLDLERYHASTLIRVCDPIYSVEPLKQRGINVYDWKFEDGGWPPNEMIQRFLQLCLDVFTSSSNCIAIHCVAGLGRAPILVAIALLETGMKFDDAIFLIRSQRRGALNDKQVDFLRQYKSSSRLRKLRYGETKQRKSCAIM